MNHLSTRQVADLLKVSESSVKRWCNRGLIPTVRTLGGHRRIPAEGLQAFLEKSDLPQPASSLIDQVIGNKASSSDTTNGVPESPDALRASFLAGLRNGDFDRCNQAMKSWLELESSNVATLADDLIASVFEQIGEQWKCGELEVFEERQGCEICTRLLSELHNLLPPVPGNAPLAIGGAPEGDHYSLPTQLADLVLNGNGWKTMNLGPNLPLSSIRLATEKHKPKLLWMSVSHLEDPSRFTEEFALMTRDLPPELIIVIGGRALTDAVRPKLKYTVHCDNMNQLASFAQALLGPRRPVIASNN